MKFQDVIFSTDRLWIIVRGCDGMPIPEGLGNRDGTWYYPATPRYARLLSRRIDNEHVRFVLSPLASTPGGERMICRRVGREFWLAAPPQIVDGLGLHSGLGASNDIGFSFRLSEWISCSLDKEACRWGMIFDN